jgi:starvation-inducible DNA-binding protein
MLKNQPDTHEDMKPEIGITEKHLHKSITLLAAILANEMTLYVKTRKFHWNVSGDSFMELHKLFKAQYTELEQTIDLVAERISKLGGKTIGTMKEFAELSTLKESPDKYPSQKDMMKELLGDYETVIVQLRKDIEVCNEKNKDAGTTDFLTGIIEQHETSAWVLRRYLN